jgi:hypothetical protein
MLNGKQFHSTHYNIEYTYPLLFNIDREEVALIVFDQLLIFNPRQLSFTKQFTIPIPNINWKEYEFPVNDVVASPHSGIVENMIMLSYSHSLIRFIACDTNIIINIDTGYVVDKFESKSITLYLGDNKLLTGSYDVYDINTRSILDSMHYSTGIVFAILLADNNIGVWQDCTLNIYHFDQKLSLKKKVTFSSLSKRYDICTVDLIDHSTIAVSTNHFASPSNLVHFLDINSGTEIRNLDLGPCEAIIRITNTVLLAWDCNYTLCLFDMKRNEMIRDYSDESKEAERLPLSKTIISVVVGQQGHICLSSCSEVVLVWDLGWPILPTYKLFFDRLRSCSAFADVLIMC